MGQSKSKEKSDGDKMQQDNTSASILPRPSSESSSSSASVAVSVTTTVSAVTLTGDIDEQWEELATLIDGRVTKFIRHRTGYVQAYANDRFRIHSISNRGHFRGRLMSPNSNSNGEYQDRGEGLIRRSSVHVNQEDLLAAMKKNTNARSDASTITAPQLTSELIRLLTSPHPNFDRSSCCCYECSEHLLVSSDWRLASISRIENAVILLSDVSLSHIPIDMSQCDEIDEGGMKTLKSVLAATMNACGARSYIPKPIQKAKHPTLVLSKPSPIRMQQVPIMNSASVSESDSVHPDSSSSASSLSMPSQSSPAPASLTTTHTPSSGFSFLFDKPIETLFELTEKRTEASENFMESELWRLIRLRGDRSRLHQAATTRSARSDALSHPLHLLAEYKLSHGAPTITELIDDYYCDPNCHDENGRTPLHNLLLSRRNLNDLHTQLDQLCKNPRTDINLRALPQSIQPDGWEICTGPPPPPRLSKIVGSQALQQPPPPQSTSSSARPQSDEKSEAAATGTPPSFLSTVVSASTSTASVPPLPSATSFRPPPILYMIDAAPPPPPPTASSSISTSSYPYQLPRADLRIIHSEPPPLYLIGFRQFHAFIYLLRDCHANPLILVDDHETDNRDANCFDPLTRNIFKASSSYDRDGIDKWLGIINTMLHILDSGESYPIEWEPKKKQKVQFIADSVEDAEKRRNTIVASGAVPTKIVTSDEERNTIAFGLIHETNEPVHINMSPKPSYEWTTMSDAFDNISFRSKSITTAVPFGRGTANDSLSLLSQTSASSSSRSSPHPPVRMRIYEILDLRLESLVRQYRHIDVILKSAVPSPAERYSRMTQPNIFRQLCHRRLLTVYQPLLLDHVIADLASIVVDYLL